MKKIDIDKIKNIKELIWIPEKIKWENKETNSWFDIKEFGTFDTGEKTNIVDQKVRSRMIRIFPDEKQKKILLEWLELSRLTYNFSVKWINKRGSESYFSLRKKIKPLIKSKYKIRIKLSKIPSHVLDYAIKDAKTAFNSAFSNLKKKNIKYFRVRSKKHSCPRKHLTLEKVSMKKESFYVRTLGKKIKSNSDDISSNHDSKLTYDGKNFNLFIPETKSFSKVLDRNKLCALDPGIRTFQTIYSPYKGCIKICSEQEKLKNLQKRILKVSKCNKMKWYNKYIRRLRTKQRNLIKDLHWKTSNYLCKKFCNILIGKLSTKSIVKKGGNLNKRTKDITYNLSHYLFVQRLKSKASEFGSNVYEVDESYTSKTCGGCGEINNSLGSSKIFKCLSCKLVIDRDINGARNILIKNTTFS